MAAKIKTRAGTSQGFEIVANREGLMSLALTCLEMAIQPEVQDTEQVMKSGGNHFHFAEWASNVEEGSDDFMIVYNPDL
jgi:hypothetical protein